MEINYYNVLFSKKLGLGLGAEGFKIPSARNGNRQINPSTSNLMYLYTAASII